MAELDRHKLLKVQLALLLFWHVARQVDRGNVEEGFLERYCSRCDQGVVGGPEKKEWCSTANDIRRRNVENDLSKSTDWEKAKNFPFDVLVGRDDPGKLDCRALCWKDNRTGCMPKSEDNQRAYLHLLANIAQDTARTLGIELPGKPMQQDGLRTEALLKPSFRAFLRVFQPQNIPIVIRARYGQKIPDGTAPNEPASEPVAPPLAVVWQLGTKLRSRQGDMLAVQANDALSRIYALSVQGVPCLVDGESITEDLKDPVALSMLASEADSEPMPRAKESRLRQLFAEKILRPKLPGRQVYVHRTAGQMVMAVVSRSCTYVGVQRESSWRFIGIERGGACHLAGNAASLQNGNMQLPLDFTEVADSALATLCTALFFEQDGTEMTANVAQALRRHAALVDTQVVHSSRGVTVAFEGSHEGLKLAGTDIVMNYYENLPGFDMQIAECSVGKRPWPKALSSSLLRGLLVRTGERVLAAPDVPIRALREPEKQEKPEKKPTELGATAYVASTSDENILFARQARHCFMIMAQSPGGEWRSAGLLVKHKPGNPPYQNEQTETKPFWFVYDCADAGLETRLLMLLPKMRAAEIQEHKDAARIVEFVKGSWRLSQVREDPPGPPLVSLWLSSAVLQDVDPTVPPLPESRAGDMFGKKRLRRKQAAAPAAEPDLPEEPPPAPPPGPPRPPARPPAPAARPPAPAPAGLPARPRAPSAPAGPPARPQAPSAPAFNPGERMQADEEAAVRLALEISRRESSRRGRSASPVPAQRGRSSNDPMGSSSQDPLTRQQEAELARIRAARSISMDDEAARQVAAEAPIHTLIGDGNRTAALHCLLAVPQIRQWIADNRKTDELAGELFATMSDLRTKSVRPGPVARRMIADIYQASRIVQDLWSKLGGDANGLLSNDMEWHERVANSRPQSICMIMTGSSRESFAEQRTAPGIKNYRLEAIIATAPPNNQQVAVTFSTNAQGKPIPTVRGDQRLQGLEDYCRLAVYSREPGPPPAAPRSRSPRRNREEPGPAALRSVRREEPAAPRSRSPRRGSVASAPGASPEHKMDDERAQIIADHLTPVHSLIDDDQRSAAVHCLLAVPQIRHWIALNRTNDALAAGLFDAMFELQNKNTRLKHIVKQQISDDPKASESVLQLWTRLGGDPSGLFRSSMQDFEQELLMANAQSLCVLFVGKPAEPPDVPGYRLEAFLASVSESEEVAVTFQTDLFGKRIRTVRGQDIQDPEARCRLAVYSRLPP